MIKLSSDCLYIYLLYYWIFLSRLWVNTYRPSVQFNYFLWSRYVLTNTKQFPRKGYLSLDGSKFRGMKKRKNLQKKSSFPQMMILQPQEVFGDTEAFHNFFLKTDFISTIWLFLNWFQLYTKFHEKYKHK